jgi:O-antigen/teichoic acid export membrane protein
VNEIKIKALGAAKWNFLGKVVNIGFEIAVGIILARLLVPADFGLVAIISVIISFSLIFVNSGFSQSLVRDQEVKDIDYSTIFLFNLVIGLICYSLLFFFAPLIAGFYNNSQLAVLIRVLGLSIIIGSLTLVQRVRLTRSIDFKELSKISIVASITSGCISIVLAFNGFGIWSLIAKAMFKELIQTLLFWLRGEWRPSFNFSKIIFKKHFFYGSNFLYSAIIGQVYNNILAITIGKMFSLQTLGYYNRSQLFSNTISENIGGVMTEISFPALAKVQNDKEKFVQGVRLLLKQAFYIIGLLTIIVFFTAKTFIPLLLGEQWINAGIYLQYLVIVGFLGVLNSILVNSISVTGRARIYLYFQIWALLLNSIVLIIGYFYGIENMLKLLIHFYLISYFLISYVFSHYFSYSLIMQIWDFKKSIILFLILIAFGFLCSLLLENGNYQMLFYIVIFTIVTYIYSNQQRIEEYNNLKQIFFRN